MELPTAEMSPFVVVVDGVRKERVLFFTVTESAADGLAIPLELVRAPAAYTGIRPRRNEPDKALGDE